MTDMTFSMVELQLHVAQQAVWRFEAANGRLPSAPLTAAALHRPPSPPASRAPARPPPNTCGGRPPRRHAPAA